MAQNPGLAGSLFSHLTQLLVLGWARAPGVFMGVRTCARHGTRGGQAVCVPPSLRIESCQTANRTGPQASESPGSVSHCHRHVGFTGACTTLHLALLLFPNLFL